MDETFDPSSAPEATRVAYYGALFAMADADGSIDKDEIQALFAMVDFEGLSDDAQRTVRSYLVAPPHSRTRSYLYRRQRRFCALA